MQRYAKAARAQQFAGQMPYHVVKYGILVHQDLEAVLDGNLQMLEDQRAIAFGQLSHDSVAKAEGDSAQSLPRLKPLTVSSD